MAPILTIFGPNRSCRRVLFFENISNERRRHRGIVVVVMVAVVLVGRFGVASITGPSLGFGTLKPTGSAAISKTIRAAIRFLRRNGVFLELYSLGVI